MAFDSRQPVLALTGMLLSTFIGAAEPFRHDVFARPTLASLTVAPSESPSGNPAAAWNPRLSAVMVAGRSSLATIDGKILKVGEQADGLQLLSVREGEVVVIKDGQRYVLTMAAPAPISVKVRGDQ